MAKTTVHSGPSIRITRPTLKGGLPCHGPNSLALSKMASEAESGKSASAHAGTMENPSSQSTELINAASVVQNIQTAETSSVVSVSSGKSSSQGKSGKKKVVSRRTAKQ